MVLWAVGAISACQGSASAPVGRTALSTRRPPIELGVRTTSGHWLELESLRGQRVLVFVFATFDTASQAALRPLSRLIETHPELTVIGIAAQPHADGLIDAWVHALAPPFVVGWDPTESIERGLSAFGRIVGVPSFIMLDEEGYEQRRVEGYQTTKQLEALVRNR